MRTFPLSAKAIVEVRKARAAGFKVEFVAAPNPLPFGHTAGMVRVATWKVDAVTTVTLDANGGLGRITLTAVPIEPPPGSWAATARLMAEGDDSGFDWDRWKDEQKERDWEEETGSLPDG